MIPVSFLCFYLTLAPATFVDTSMKVFEIGVHYFLIFAAFWNFQPTGESSFAQVNHRPCNACLMF